MTTLLFIIQFLLVLIICIVVLLQKSSSIGLGAYSGSNESLFGAKGPAGFLAKFTFIMGLLLIINTIALSYIYNTKTTSSSIAEKASSLIPPSTEINTSVAPVAPSAPQVENNTSN